MRMGKGSVRVVEFLEDSISKELLSKFPQQIISSSLPSDLKLDFNYSESSIWSPLVKPHLLPLQLDNYDEKKNNKISSKPIDSQSLNFCINNTVKQSRKKKMKKRSGTGDLFDSCSDPLLPSSSSPLPKKRWTNILKAGPKCFKKSSKMKNHIVSHLSMSNCFHGSIV